MALKVVCFARYLTGEGVPWRPDDHNVHKFIQALKGDEINQYARIPVRGRRRELRNTNADDAIKWFGQWAAEYLAANPVTQPFLLVPIPNSTSLKNSGEPPRTRLLAEAIAAENGTGDVSDIIRYRQELLSARRGGPRDAQTIYNNLLLAGPIRDRIRVVLVDDVMTIGGHLQAVAAFLREHGAKTRLAICAGRTVLDPHPKSFGVIELELDDFVP